MRIRIGPPATGDDFFPRLKLRAKLLRCLSRGHVAFVGPRRTGKTSILKGIQNDPPTGIKAVFLDLEKFDNVPDWIAGMVAETKKCLALAESARKGSVITGLMEVIKRIEKIEAMGASIQLSAGQPAAKQWRPLAEEFTSLVCDTGIALYFLLDEFPWFLAHVAKKHTPEEVDALLNWFRSARQQCSGYQIRFLLTGSIGLDALLRRLGLSPAANDLDTVEIPPLDDEEALLFLEKLATDEGVILSASGRRHILNLLGANWPILLELFVSEIQEAGFASAPDKAALNRIYTSQLVRGSRNRYCQEMFTRLHRGEIFSVTERRLALEILSQLTKRDSLPIEELEAIHARLVPDASVRDLIRDEFDFVLDGLRHDGYLIRHEMEGHQFASRILRDYWKFRLA